MSHLLDGPAGNHGFVKVEKGRFVTEAGTIRFNATNLTGPANFPDRSQADSIAARLARFGFNCIRLHYMDSPYGNFLHKEMSSILKEDPKTQRDLDSDQLDKMDYLISALKKRGIYVNMNLHVARWWDERDGFTGKDRRPAFDKGLDNFEPRMIELQKEYAKKLLSHVNPYTGLAYTDDPCVAMIELNNENALFRQYMTGGIDRLPEPYASEFRNQWNSWLKRKYKSTESLKKAWMSDTTVIGLKAGMKAPTNLIGEKENLENGTVATLVAGNPAFAQAKKDFFQFMIDTERS
ncbi:MAG TPA: cellulase family glycosylhydrolase, partial [Bacteroidales bacterium]|nr:cellulase family glycosylhydrolase [Bacteroidales bacterium]